MASGDKELDANTLLKRYCFLGSLEPVFMHRSGDINVTEYWVKLLPICTDLDGSTIALIIRDVLHKYRIVRHDEAIFAYAVYLAAVEVEMKAKLLARKAFPTIITNDEDLFLFCKYAMKIQEKVHNRKGFSQTSRKAIVSWYNAQQPDTIRGLWLVHRGAHGFTHKKLIKLCHVTDDHIGALDAVTPFFRTCSELVNAEMAEEACAPSPAQQEIAATSAAAGQQPKVGKKRQKQAAKQQATSADVSAALIVAMSKLRITNSKNLAKKIVTKYNLSYNQVPRNRLRYPPIMETLIPRLSYIQLIKSWGILGRYNLLMNKRILALCSTTLNNMMQLQKANIHPIVFLQTLRTLCVRGDWNYLSKREYKANQIQYFNKIYMNSFGQNQATGLRMNITINLQESYKKKHLKNIKKLTVFEAAVALAFGYFKTEKLVQVFHWTDSKLALGNVPWTKKMDIEAALKSANSIENAKNAQRLTLPVMKALNKSEIFDVFLTIVPTAGRGNPNHKSELLCMFLDKYRQKKNPKAKFIILNLLKHKKSLRYSTTRNENILEICGLDEKTADLIENFALNRFS